MIIDNYHVFIFKYHFHFAKINKKNKMQKKLDKVGFDIMKLTCGKIRID